MTVKELIEELQKLDPEMIVVTSHPEDYSGEPSILVKKYDFNTYYWSGSELKNLPKDIEFLEL